MLSQRIALLVTCLTVLACATPASSGTSAAPKPTADLITAAELATAAPGDLYAAIQELRSGFLRTRGATSVAGAGNRGSSPAVLQVYVNGTPRGTLDVLHQISTADVKEVQRLSAIEATQRYGTGNMVGAIVVTLK
ncbi:MAG TPA: hypothetical protein VLS53_06360 [Candidatus Dormibacteraeota bacterium]|nr:hypothetical protein [Candidatus Dormibacteraeota bacterium]